MTLEKRKIIVSLLAGWLGFALNFLPTFITLGEFKITFLTGLLPVMMISLLLGPKYAFIAAVPGLGGMSCWFIWAGNGYANIVTALLYSSWFVWHGYLSELRLKKSAPWWSNIYLGELVFRIVYALFLYFGYHLLFPLNPPFWYPQAGTEVMSDPVMTVLLLKTAFNGFLFLLLSEGLIFALPLRRLLGMVKMPHYRGHSVIFSLAGAVTLLYWLLDSFYLYFFINPESRSLFELMVSYPNPLSFESRFFVAFLCLVGALVGVKVFNRFQETQKNLRDSRAKNQLLAETISDMIWEIDREERITYLSPISRDLLGIEPGELIGESMEHIFTPLGFRSKEGEIYRSIREKRSFKGLIHRFTRSDGHQVILESSGVPFFDEEGQLLGYRGIDRDITERIQAEEEAMLFKSIADQASHGVAVSDMKYILLYVNDTFASIHGYTKEELIGQHISLFYDSETQQQLNENRELFEQSGSIKGQEIVHFKKDKNPLPLMISATRIYDKFQDTHFIASTCIDMTERKELENQLLQKQKMESIGQLAGGIAHDYNNILTGILTSAEILKELQPEPEAQEYIDIIILATERAARLSTNLLVFSRKKPMVNQIFTLEKSIKETVDLLRSTIPKDVELETRITGENTPIYGDPSRIESILLNICINGAQAIQDKGRILIETENRELDSEFCWKSKFDLDPGTYCEIRISDNGEGMEESLTERIFEPFFTTKEKGQGTGLGLSSTYGTVQQHKGSIAVSSKPNQGSCFTILLPVYKEKSIH